MTPRFLNYCFSSLLLRCRCFAALLLLSCTQQKTEEPLFTLMEKTGITFRNNVKDSKEDNGFLFRNFYNGGGVATGDVNNDGLPDTFFTSNQGENKLYLNRGNFRFEDVSVKAGLEQEGYWNTGVTFVDINADGWLDIYVCASGHLNDGRRKNKLYVNQRGSSGAGGDVTFKEEASAYGLDISGYCTQAAFFDYDRDGDLDMFLINNSPVPFSSLDYAGMRDVDVNKWNVDEKLKGGGNHLYQNNGGMFSEQTAAAGLHTGLISFGLGVSVCDVNEDGWPDLYVGNDFIEKDYLYINQRNGTFSDELENRVQKISMSSMSTDVADINNDGHAEIFTTDMIPDDDYRLKTTGTFDNVDLYRSKQKAGLYHQYVRNCLQLNNGDGTFSEIGNYSGVYGTDWSWGAVFFDADNDGLNDLFVCNGIARDVGDLDFLDFFSNDVYNKMLETGQKMEMSELLGHIPSTPLRNRAFRNRGALQFEDATENWGFTQSGFSNSVAYADLDKDGDLDLLLNRENGEALVYRNEARQQTGNHFLSVQLAGEGLNRFAIGAKIRAYAGRQVFCREVLPVRGFQSSMDYRQVMGLGTIAELDSLVIVWADGKRTKRFRPAVDQSLTVRQNSAEGNLEAAQTRDFAPLFDTVATVFDKHTEDDYVDFYYERNLPEMLSRQGPRMATADVNGDALDDLYIGGAKGQGGQLYLQTKDGDFRKKEEPAFASFREFEDVAVLFLDADKDGDADLFIGAGGNNVQRGGREIQHRLFVNDGRGNFSLNAAAFPPNNSNISVAVANDYDGDGDLDLFVGGNSVPYSYGSLPQSYLYENDGRGAFADVTQKRCPQLAYIGMVTGAVWANVTGDAQRELVVVGEWMSPKVFQYTSGKFIESKDTGLENLSGWWQTVVAADLNGDGKEDLVLGNIGENFYLRPAAEKPARLWVADFDNSGTPDAFLTQSIKGKDLPVFLKREVTEQFPFLKKANLKHSDYAKKTVQDLFGEAALSKANVRSFNACQSVVAISTGNRRFAVKPLPLRAQLSSVNAICVSDVNGDGKPDLLTGGNLFTFPPQFGRLDASYGEVLLNDGAANFSALPNPQSGLRLRGEVKGIKALQVGGRTQYLFTQNNERPVCYRYRQKR